MRKIWGLVLLMCLLPAAALAQDALPAGVQELLDAYYGQRQPAEYAEIVLDDGSREGIAVVGERKVFVFRYGDGAWRMNQNTFVMDELYPARPELVPGDALAIRIVRRDGSAGMTYRFDGVEFRLAGWFLPGVPPVTVDDEMLTYGDDDSAFSTVLPGGVTDWPAWAEALPVTPAEALARAAISEPNAAGMFPGYTLRGYLSGRNGAQADAAYSRIDESGTLHIRRVLLEAGREPRVTDCLPIPLSDELLARLETEPFDDLIWCWLGGDTFRTRDAFSRQSFPLPEGAVIRQNRVEEDGLIVLAEAEGVTRLYVWEAEGAGVSMRCTQPLPEDVYLDFFHAGDGNVQLEWGGQNMSASFVRRADGQWRLSWCTVWGPSADASFGANAFGITFYDENYRKRMRVGTLADSDLFSLSISDLDGTAPDLDQSGWAVVSNPDPADRLHLRDRAQTSARSQGKFYNGTPVRVLQRKGDWTLVQIGLGETARTGWMMTKYLAFGPDMDRVRNAFPELCFRVEYAHEDRMDGPFWVVGVQESGEMKQYILLGEDGVVTYVPQTWLFGGYG